jgi:hypothetical protein
VLAHVTHPRALQIEGSANRSTAMFRIIINLSATNTDRALSAWTPNTFLKNKPATITPDNSISFLLAALENISTLALSKEGRKKRPIRKIRNISQEIQNSTNAKSKWPSNLECAYWIFDIIQNIIDTIPSSIGIENF